MTPNAVSVLKGTLDLLVLRTLGGGEEMHGFEILDWITESTGGTLAVEEGALYPALHRLQRQKLLKAYWVEADTSEGGRRRKYYKLTPKGKAALKSKREEWARFAAGVSGVLGQRHVVA